MTEAACEVDPEVLQRALENFNPIVFTLSSASPETVSTDKILDGLKRDEAFQNVLYAIDARPFVKDFLSAKPQNGKSKSTGDSKKNHQIPEGAKSPAQSLREEYVKIALGRETDRMAALQAKTDLLNSLKAQYLEDGMSEEEAHKAAEEDMKEEEEDEDQEAVNAPQRTTLYLCIIGYPNSIDDILEIGKCKVPLDCLLNIVSKVPLSGSSAVEVNEKPNDKSRGKNNDQGKSAGKRGKVAEDDVSKVLIEQLAQRNRERKMEEYNAADEVLLHTYEFPCDELPPRTPDGAPVYRLAGSEKAGLMAITEALIQIEESLHLFRQWKSKRTVVHVPKYKGLLDPDAPKPVPVELVEEKNKRKRSVSSNSKKGIQPPPEPIPETPVLTTEDLRAMGDVAANREKYDDTMLRHRLNSSRFSVLAFINSCITQAAASTTILSDKSARAEKEMLNSKHAVGRFADYIFHEIMGIVDATVAAKPTVLNTASENKDPVAGNSEPMPAKDESFSKEAEMSDEEREKITQSKGRLLGAEGLNVIENIDTTALIDIISSGITATFPNIPSEVIEEQIKKVLFFGYGSLNTADGHSFFGRFWYYKNMHAWRPFSCKWGDFFVDILTKGDGTSRTQQLTYSFEGPTTFPEFVAEQKFCETEKAYFYPPAAESDDEPEEEEEEEEDEEDEEGNIIPRKKKEPEPFPFLDHVSIIQRLMRKRRVNESVIQHLSTPSEQETVNHGHGARSATEEVEWMFPQDGTIIEVERSAVNTKQMSCLASPPRGLEFGFLFCESPNTEAIQEYVPSHIRSFVERERSVKVIAEVVADNTVAAEKMAYEKAVEEAKLEAKKQLEVLQTTKKSARGKDKAAVLPTLADLEETCINAIPRPKSHEKCPPTLQISALFDDGNTFVSFNEVEETLHLKTCSWVTNTVDLPIRVWRNNKMDDILLTTVSHLYVHADGSIEVFSPQSQGYRVLLGANGTYMTEKDNQCLTVSFTGKCSLRTAETVARLTCLKLSDNVDWSTKDVITEREDGVQLISHSGKLRGVNFGSNTSVSWSGDECAWSFAGFPIVKCNNKLKTLGIEHAESLLSFDLSKNKAVLTCLEEEFCATFDFIEYRLQVYPVDGFSVYTVDCAFGGMFGRVTSGNESIVYRVSPFGRCSEEKDGLLVLPKGYVTPEIQPLMRLPEIWSPSFVETLVDTDVLVERDALHLLEHAEADIILRPSTKKPMLNKAIESFYSNRGAETLKKITSTGISDRRVLSCACVTNPERSLSIVFVEPPTTYLISKQFLRHFNALYSCAFDAYNTANIKEYLLAINSPFSSKEKMKKVLLPSTVDDLFLATKNANNDSLLWYWLIRSLNPEALNMNFFHELFDMSRLQRGYEEALEFLCSRLPLAQKEEFLPGVFETPNTTMTTELREETKKVKTEEQSLALREKNKINSDGSAGETWGATNRLNYWRVCKDVIDETLWIPKETLPREPPKRNLLIAPQKVTSIQTTSTQYNKTPLMVSHAFRAAVDTGKTASSRGHAPKLSFTPQVLRFGSIKTRRCYAAMIYLTNTSSVPCRYRVTVPKEFKRFVSIQYPRRFMAPGLSEGVEVRILGNQPVGDIKVPLTLAHEGGSYIVVTELKTVELETEVSLSPAALCVGETSEQFIPGTTKRFKRRNSDDIVFDEEVQDDSSNDDSESVPF